MKTRTTARKQSQAAFTLIEIMVVVLIIGLLVGLVGPNVYNSLIRGKKGTARAQLKTLAGQVQMFELNNERLPDTLDELTEPDPVSGKPYMDRIPLDPWGYEYELVVNNDGTFEVVSYGRDGSPGGDGEDEDLSSRD